LIVTTTPRRSGRAISERYTETHGPLLPTASPARNRPRSIEVYEPANVMKSEPSRKNEAVTMIAGFRPILDKE
jgi:hypothetical protein